MSTTSANAVDVLEVISHAIHCVRPGVSEEHYRWHKRLTEARASVAELIEAATAAVERSKSLHKKMTPQGLAVRNRVQAALANCKPDGEASAVSEVDELIALSEKATAGPWTAIVATGDRGGWDTPKQVVSIGNDSELVAHYETSFMEYPSDVVNEENAKFIAALVNWFRATAPTLATPITAQKE